MKVELSSEHGWIGRFSRDEALGNDVIPNGTRIVKASSETGVPAGTLGVVLGSAYTDKARDGLFIDRGDQLLYFVEWDCAPRTAMLVHDYRVARA